MRTRAARLVFAVAVMAALSAGTLAQSALAKPGMRARGVASLKAFCTTSHIPCAARRTRVDGEEVYALKTRFNITGKGRVIAHTANWTGEMSNMGTGLCMSSLGTYSEGTIARQEYCNATYNQSWYAVTQGIGGVELVNYADGWCLTNAEGRAANDNPQTMWPCHGNYYKDTYHLSGGGPGGSLHLADDAPDFNPNGYCVTSNGNVSPGSPVVEHQCNFSLNQFWSGPIGVLG